LAEAVPLPAFDARYTLRPPQAYTLQPRGGPGRIAWSWLGPASPDGTRPTLTMTVLALPVSQEPDRRTADDFLALRTRSLPATLTNWRTTEMAKGTIHGIPFARCHWTATPPVTHAPLTGFLYIARRDRSIVEVSGIAPTPDPTQKAPPPLTLLENAARTLQAQPLTASP